eukprot:scaffold20974_cov55-Phaeocystis_antarctica.AAC.2
MPCACSGTTLSRGKERTQQRVVQHLVDASPDPASACALVELCHRVGKGGQQQAARRGEHHRTSVVQRRRSRARAVRKASRRVNSTEHVFKRDRSFIPKTRDRSFITGDISAGITSDRGFGAGGESELGRLEAPRGEKIPRHSMMRWSTTGVRPKSCRAIPHGQTFSGLAVCILHCKD